MNNEQVSDLLYQDRLNWQLLGQVAGRLKGEEARALGQAYQKIGDQEDEHLDHTRGWTRELWLESLGLAGVLLPPEAREEGGKAKPGRTRAAHRGAV